MEKIREELQKTDIAGILSDMIKIPSFSFMEEQEKEIAGYIKDFFDKEEIPCQIYEIEPGRYNVTAVIRGAGGGRSLNFSGHMDTVPAYDMEGAFDGRISDGKVFGRGACDMKGPIAAMMAAMAAIKRSGTVLKGDLYFTGVADEEEQGKGTAYMIKNGPHADGVIVGEPTDMRLSPGNKGLEWIEVSFKGKKVHGGRQKEGINAIQMASRFVSKVYDEYVPLLDSREYPVLGAPTINIGTISGGDQPSTVPDHCKIVLDRRMVPSETIEQVYEELRELGEELHREDPRFECEVRDVFDGLNLLPHLPFLTDENDPIMTTVKDIYNDRGKEIVIEPFPAWTDAGFISSQTQSKCLVLGPGKLKVAHSVDEYIDIDQMEEAAEIYAETALRYCGRK